MKFILNYILLCALVFAFSAHQTDIQPYSPDSASDLAQIASPVATDTVEWDKPRFDERNDERAAMVQTVKSKGIDDSATLEALQHVPRHLFVNKPYQSYAYEDRPLPIEHDQTISQPFIVAFMTQMLDLQAGEKVLEIGTGSGYQAAVLSELTPEVYTIEIVEPLGEQAQKRFKELGYSTIQTKIGDGYKGWPEHAPFDAIIVTAAAGEVPDPLVEQLKPGGTMVIPVGETNGTQILSQITKDENGEVEEISRLPVRFVPMTGEIQNQ